MNEEKYNLLAKKISKNFNDEVEKYNSEKKYSSFKSFIAPFDGLADDEIDAALEKQINEYLQSIIGIAKEKLKNDNNFRKCYRLLDEMTDIFCDNNTNGDLLEEANCVADDLFRKSIGYKGRTIKLPVKLEYIKEYSITCIYDNNEIRPILYYVLLELSILDYVLNNENI